MERYERNGIIFFGDERIIPRAFLINEAKKRGVSPDGRIMVVWFGGMLCGIIGAAAGLQVQLAGLAGVASIHVAISVGSMNGLALCLQNCQGAVDTYFTVAEDLRSFRWRGSKARHALDVLKKHAQPFVSDSLIRSLQPEFRVILVQDATEVTSLDPRTSCSPSDVFYGGMALPGYARPVQIGEHTYQDCFRVDIRQALRKIIWSSEPSEVVFVLNRAGQIAEVESIMEGIPLYSNILDRVRGDRGVGITCTQPIPYCGIAPGEQLTFYYTNTTPKILQRAADTTGAFMSHLLDKGAKEAQHMRWL